MPDKLERLDFVSARTLGRAIAAKKISSAEATQAAIARLDQAHQLTHCIIARDVAPPAGK